MMFATYFQIVQKNIIYTRAIWKKIDTSFFSYYVAGYEREQNANNW